MIYNINKWIINFRFIIKKIKRQMFPNIHTIVIGSGMGGMGAASQLALNGQNVLVLQCNGHIGGRTSTTPVKLADQTIFPFDLGASWIHKSQNQHPITQLAYEMGNVELLFTDDDSIVFYDENGRSVDDQVQEQYNRYEEIIEKIENYEGLSVYEGIKKINERKLSNKYFMYNISYDIQFETSSPIQDLSASKWAQDSQFAGKEMIVMTGYQRFPEFLSQNQNIKVLTNHQVIEISSNGTKNIVKCSNGKIFQAQNVIVGVPIGALKGNNIRFNPDLPSWKKEAIQKIHFGNVCKILIILKNKFINSSQTYIGVVLNDIQKRGCATFFLNLQALAGVPALMTFGLGANAEDLEYMPEKQLKELIASRLRVFSDQSFNSNDFDIVRTSWRGNPNFRGTYSYAGVDTMSEHWENMARPIFESNLYFCGEHTHSKYRGSVHGAYLSGIDAASYILNETNNETWEYFGAESGDQEQGQYQEQGQEQGYEQQYEGQPEQGYGQGQENYQAINQERPERIARIQAGSGKKPEAKGGKKPKLEAKGGKKPKLEAKSGKRQKLKAKGGKNDQINKNNPPKEASPECCQIS